MNASQEKLVTGIVQAHEAAQAEIPYGERQRSVSLTNDEWNRLRCYILMTTKYREGERDAWARLAEEVDESGAPAFPNAAKNADYWAELDAFLGEVSEKIDGVNAILKGEYR